MENGIDRAALRAILKCCTGNASHAWRRKGPGSGGQTGGEEEESGGRWMEGGQGRWTRRGEGGWKHGSVLEEGRGGGGTRRAARENKIKEGNRWQFFTSFLKRGLGTRGESLNRFFRRAPFFSRLLVRQPTRALPTYLPT